MKTITVENSTYSKLSKLKFTLNKMRRTSLTFSELLEEVLRNPLGILLIDATLREALKSLVKYLSQDESVIGVILFGSVVKKTSHANSDVDLFILAKDAGSRTFDYVERSIRKTEIEFFDRLVESKLPVHFAPFICSLEERDYVRPIFFDIADSGMIIFDRNSVASEFLDKYISMPHNRNYTENGEVLTW
ncbi:MAG: nucleotidyltransferase domain-containing protein [Thermoplasmataceae archaeon]